MIRGIYGLAFLRWGMPGVLCITLLLIGMAWWFMTTFSWLITGLVWILGLLAGLGYLVLLVAAVLWLRGRRQSEHLLDYGRRRRWLE